MLGSRSSPEADLRTVPGIPRDRFASGHTLPVAPEWNWKAVRNLIVFVLGCIIILEALIAQAVDGSDPWPEIFLGAIMVGVFPLDELPIARRRWRDNERNGP